MDYSNRTYAFADWADIGSVDFAQVMDTHTHMCFQLSLVILRQ